MLLPSEAALKNVSILSQSNNPAVPFLLQLLFQESIMRWTPCLEKVVSTIPRNIFTVV
jgi:hypothetical protein